jgi:homopolymeric O-antigen transport system permease protein
MKSESVLRTGKAMTTPRAQEDAEQWTTVIRAKHRWLDLDLGAVWNSRDLIKLFVRRDFVTQYKQTVLGPSWFVLKPLLTTMIFSVVFGRVLKIPTDNIPPFLFFLSGTVCWEYFSSCLLQTSDSLITNSGLLGKVYFPRLVIPIAIISFQALKFFVQLVLFGCFLLYFYVKGAPVAPKLWLLAFPLLLVQMALLSLGCGTFVASLTTKYRDFSIVMTFGIQLWMYATPVVYPLSQVPAKYRFVYALNPMTSVVENFRAIFMGTPPLSIAFTSLGCVSTLALLFVGLVLFSRIQRTFIDTI